MSTLRATAYSGSALIFDGLNDTLFSTLTGNVTGIRFWIKLESLTQSILSFDTDHADKRLTINGGSFTWSGAETLTVNVLKGTIEVGKWIEVQITLSSAVTVTGLCQFGLANTNYFDGMLAELVLTGTAATHYTLIESWGLTIFDIENEHHARVVGAIWSNLLSGKENGETHTGIPQNIEYNHNQGTNYEQGGVNPYQIAVDALQWEVGKSFEVQFYHPNNANTGINNALILGRVRGSPTFDRISINRLSNGVEYYAYAREFGVGGAANVTHAHTGADFKLNSINTIRVRITGQSFSDVIIELNGVSLTKAANASGSRNPDNWYPDYAFADDLQFQMFRGTSGSAAANFGVSLSYIKNYTDDNFMTLFKDYQAKNRYVDGATKVESVVSKINFPEKNSGFDVFGQSLLQNINVGVNQVFLNTNQSKGLDRDTTAYALINSYIELETDLNFNEGVIYLLVAGRNKRRETALGILIDGRDALNDGLSIQSNASNELVVFINNQNDAYGTIPDATTLITVWLKTSETSVSFNDGLFTTIVRTGGNIDTLAKAVIGGESYGSKTNYYANLIACAGIFKSSHSESVVTDIRSQLLTKYGL